jgi:hypothetical protein
MYTLQDEFVDCYTDDALAQQLASELYRRDIDFLYIARLDQWFRGGIDDDGNPAWLPDHRGLEFRHWVRLFLRGVAQQCPSREIRRRLGSFECIRTIAELAKDEFADPDGEALLEPGAYARSKELSPQLLDCIKNNRREDAQRAQAASAAPSDGLSSWFSAPASPSPAPPPEPTYQKPIAQDQLAER